MTKNEVIKSLYNQLKPVQKEMFNSFFNSASRKFIIHSSRRLGKTYLLCVLSLIFAINKPNSQIRYASGTQKAVRKMVQPIFKELINTLPLKFKPKFNSQEGAYVFNNGSMIHVAGVNNGRADNLRGTSSDLAVIDESGFVDELTYLTESVLMPQLLSVPGSRLIMASSSPLSPAHEFTTYINQAKLDGSYASFDIHSADYPQQLIEEFCKEAGGATSTTWRREYLNELITDEQLAIIPEWKKEYIQEAPKDEYRNFFHNYTAMDIGVRDLTVVLFAHYDFKKATLYVEDEFTISGAETTTKNIAENIELKEKDLGYTNVYRRPADNNNLILLQDLSSMYNKHFFGTTKDSLAAMVNEVRLWAQAGRIKINPRCSQLIGSLEYGVYQDSKRKEFGRSKVFGHFDALAALIYLVRNIDVHTNPIPSTYGTSPQNTWFPNGTTQDSTQIQNIKKILNL